MKTTTPLTIRIGVPHFFRELHEGSGYGSGRPGQTLARSIALGRCLSSLLALRRTPEDAVLHIGDRCIEHWESRPSRLQRLSAIEVEIHVFTDGTHRLDPVLDLYADRIQLHNATLENPRHLPLAARNWLIKQWPVADLTLYMEDDLVISDPLFADKLQWFLQRTEQHFVLMPHRLEPSATTDQANLIVDGPLSPEFINSFCTPQQSFLRGRFDPDGEEIAFDITNNPHSGCFALGPDQVKRLQKQTLADDGFVGPLETAATLTVLAHFPVLKPAALYQRFLTIEHGHPSFLSYLQQFPHRP